jgi:TatD DNase family protein
VSFWTDAHCHLQDRYLTEWKARGDAHDALRRAHDAGVQRIVVIGTEEESSREALAVTELSGDVELYATVGLHPHSAMHDLDPIVQMAREGHPKLVGIGECGLDYYYEHSPRQLQRASFVRQLQLAIELDLALVVHARDAFDDLFDVFDSEGMPPRTVIHCFTGTPDDAAGCLARGADISLSGIVTFKNAELLREAARMVPLDRLHVETDAPFLAPVPHRGKPNEPAFVSLVGEFVAELRGEDVETLRAATSANSARLFKLPA